MRFPFPVEALHCGTQDLIHLKHLQSLGFLARRVSKHAAIRRPVAEECRCGARRTHVNDNDAHIIASSK